MYRVVISNKAYSKIKELIDNFKLIYLQRFSNTWIYNEEIIVQEYLKKAEKIQELIFDKIENYCSDKKIYWSSCYKNELKYFFIKDQFIKMKVFYIEDNKNYIREIHNIEFTRK